MCIGVHVKYPLLLDINKVRIFSTDFKEILNYRFSWKSVQWEPSRSMQKDDRSDGRTCRIDIANLPFRNFANAPKIYLRRKAGECVGWRHLA
jgi:hypothetical protein